MLTSTYAPVQQAGNDVIVDFDFSFKILAETDLQVYKIDADGVQGDLLTLEVDYTVVFDPVAETGTVTYTVAPVTSGYSLIQRSSDNTQSTSLPRESPAPAKTVEVMIDKLQMQMQELQASLDAFLLEGGTALQAAIDAAVALIDATIVVRASGTFAARPAAPTAPTMYYSTDTNSVDYWDPIAARWFTLG